MTQPTWVFEPCDPDSELSPAGYVWPHAVRGRKPAGRLVMGYGYTPPQAQSDAEQKAREYDAREVLGERGEVVAPPEPAYPTLTIAGYGTVPVMPWSAGLSILDQHGCYGVRVHYIGSGEHTVATCIHRTTIDNYNACLAAIATLEGQTPDELLAMVARDWTSMIIEVYTAS